MLKQILCIFLILSFSLQIAYPQLVRAAIVDQLPTSVTILLVCGDGLAETTETCDPGEPPTTPPDLKGLECTDFTDINGDNYLSGDLDCLSDCTAYDDSGCFSCGNNIKEDAEECDGSDFGGQTCIGFGMTGGSLVCVSDCHISLVNCESNPVSSGGGGGTSGGNPAGRDGYDPGSEIEPGETKVIAIGKSYPNSDVHVLVDGKVLGIVQTDSKADFYFETDEVPSGVTAFGFWSEDKDGLKSTLLSLTFRVTSGAVTNISGIYIAPTIDIENNSVRQGENVVVHGKTIPESKVEVHIHSDNQIVEEITSSDEGEWTLTFNTDPLEKDFHIAKALFQTEVSGNIIKSGFSKSVSFYVDNVASEAVCPEADLNGDGRVNITDFSILLYHWGSDNTCADQNQNGTVDLIDFSIMMYYWTG